MFKRILVSAVALMFGAACQLAAAALQPSGFSADITADIAGQNDSLPDIQVSAVSVRNASAFDALRLVLEKSGSGIGLTYRGNGGVPPSLRRPVVASNLEGRLPQLVEQLARVAGFFYRYDAASKVLSVYQEQQFLAYPAPSEPATMTAIKDQMIKLGGKELTDDPILGVISYRAGRQDQEWIEQYIEAMNMAKAQKNEVGNTNRADTVSARQTLKGKPEKAQSWVIRQQDGYLSNVLKRWGQESGWQVVWDAPKDFPVVAEASFSGSFESAVESLVDSLSTTDAPMQASFYANKVVRISRFSGQTSDLRR
ncbi:MAG: TcpQ domain-containing protein [Georgfuchsia sp.]